MPRTLKLHCNGALLVFVRLTALPARGARSAAQRVKRKPGSAHADARNKRDSRACKHFHARLCKQHPTYRFSLSHTKHWAVFAGARGSVGVDAESALEPVTPCMLQLLCASGLEYAWASAPSADQAARGLDLWLAKEAMFKSTQNFRKHFDPATICVRNALGWRRGLRFLGRCGLRVALCKLPAATGQR